MRKREKQARQREYSKRNREKKNLSGEVRYEVWVPKENANKYKDYIRQVVEYLKQQADKEVVHWFGTLSLVRPTPPGGARRRAVWACPLLFLLDAFYAFQ